MSKTIHTFRVVDEAEYTSSMIFAETDMKICCEANLSDILEAFERFLQAIGYLIPENSHLGFINEENDNLEGEI